MNNHIQHIHFIQSDWFENIKYSQFDIIVSNPPYIADHDPHLNQPELGFEPRQALVSNNHGMNDLNHIIKHSKQKLATNGYLIVEHGYNQGDIVKHAMQSSGFTNIQELNDLSGTWRATAGRKR